MRLGYLISKEVKTRMYNCANDSDARRLLPRIKARRQQRRLSAA